MSADELAPQTVELLAVDSARHLFEAAGGLRSMALGEALESEASAVGLPVQTPQVGTMFGVSFNEQPATNYAEVKRSDTERDGRFFHAMLEQGVYFAPSAFESAFAALPYEGAALDRTLTAIREVMPRL